MRSISVTINSLKGEVTIAIGSEVGIQVLELVWGYNRRGDFGFQTSFHPHLIRLTHVSVSVFLKYLLIILCEAIDINLDECSIIDEYGESLNDIQFLPPTFSGDVDDIADLVELQNILASVYKTFESSKRIDSALLKFCEREGVLDDFLTLLENEFSDINFCLDCLVEENNHG